MNGSEKPRKNIEAYVASEGQSDGSSFIKNITTLAQALQAQMEAVNIPPYLQNQDAFSKYIWNLRNNYLIKYTSAPDERDYPGKSLLIEQPPQYAAVMTVFVRDGDKLFIGEEAGRQEFNRLAADQGLPPLRSSEELFALLAESGDKSTDQDGQVTILYDSEQEALNDLVKNQTFLSPQLQESFTAFEKAIDGFKPFTLRQVDSFFRSFWEGTKREIKATESALFKPSNNVVHTAYYALTQEEQDILEQANLKKPGSYDLSGIVAQKYIHHMRYLAENPEQVLSNEDTDRYFLQDFHFNPIHTTAVAEYVGIVKNERIKENINTFLAFVKKIVNMSIDGQNVWQVMTGAMPTLDIDLPAHEQITQAVSTLEESEGLLKKIALIQRSHTPLSTKALLVLSDTSSSNLATSVDGEFMRGQERVGEQPNYALSMMLLEMIDILRSVRTDVEAAFDQTQEVEA